MNKKFTLFLDKIKNRKIAVIGLGISNEPLLEILSSRCEKVTAFDSMLETSDRAVALKEKFSVNWSFGPDYLEKLKGFDYIFRTPIMMPYNPYLIKEKERGAIITSEMELFMHFCPAKIFAVTGSDGKSTTSSLIHAMLVEEGYQVFLGGNIGRPLLKELGKIKKEDMVVLELSSFQLIDLTISPDIAVLTNVSPNHLNVHQDYSEYVEAKKQIYRHQNFEDRLVVNGLSDLFAQDLNQMKGQVTWFNRRYTDASHKVFVQNYNELGYQERNSNEFIPICQTQDLHIMGSFNRQNALAAMGAVSGYVSLKNMKSALEKFKGLEHRIEFIRDVNGIKFYESSIDSSPERSKHSIGAFIEQQRPVILIMGGQDKNLDYTGLGKIIAAATDRLILFGSNADLIENSVQRESHLVGRSKKDMQILHVANYQEAVQEALGLARSGDSVLLTPAGTSFDHFQNFMERGNQFKQIVMDLQA